MRLRIPPIIVFIGLLTISCSQNFNKKPKLYTVGDSTVKSGQGHGERGLWGWGDFIHQFIDSTKITVENHARSGTSSRTYMTIGLWDSVQRQLKKGDFVLIQFGHNDDDTINDDCRARGTLNGTGDETEEIDNLLTGKHEIVHTYGWYLNKMVEQAKLKGAIPIIVSPIPKNNWANDQVIRTQNTYGLWAQQVAEKNEVPFLDLNDRMASKMEEIGEAVVTGNHFYERDPVHTSARGAVLAASVLMNEVRDAKIDLEDYLIDYPQIKLPQKRNLYLIGDATMADNINENTVGWGVPFTKFIDTTRLNYFNGAMEGKSSRSFITEGLWDVILDDLKPEDFVLIQFGHHDNNSIDKDNFHGTLDGTGFETQKIVRNDTVQETVHTFGHYLRKMVIETKLKGALPIVLSLTPKNEWTKEQGEQKQDTYVKWTQEIARSEEIPFIDLNDAIAKKYAQLGKEIVQELFSKDDTHTNSEGALISAQVAAEALKEHKASGLKDYIFY